MREFAAILRAGREGLAESNGFPESMEDIAVGGVVWMIDKRLVEDPEDARGAAAPRPRVRADALPGGVGGAARRPARQVAGGAAAPLRPAGGAR